jgi:hypothetical protein
MSPEELGTESDPRGFRTLARLAPRPSPEPAGRPGSRSTVAHAHKRNRAPAQVHVVSLAVETPSSVNSRSMTGREATEPRYRAEGRTAAWAMATIGQGGRPAPRRCRAPMTPRCSCSTDCSAIVARSYSAALVLAVIPIELPGRIVRAFERSRVRVTLAGFSTAVTGSDCVLVRSLPRRLCVLSAWC